MGRYFTLRKDNNNYEYPEDMEKILKYLKEHGELKATGKEIEELYRDFSDEMYSAGWLMLDDRFLVEFAEWLDKK